MQKIDFVPGTDNASLAAFCPQKMKDAGVDAVSLSEAITARLGPLAALLANGRGIALVVRGEDASVIGLIADE